MIFTAPPPCLCPSAPSRSISSAASCTARGSAPAPAAVSSRRRRLPTPSPRRARSSWPSTASCWPSSSPSTKVSSVISCQWEWRESCNDQSGWPRGCMLIGFSFALCSCACRFQVVSAPAGERLLHAARRLRCRHPAARLTSPRLAHCEEDGGGEGHGGRSPAADGDGTSRFGQWINSRDETAGRGWPKLPLIDSARADSDCSLSFAVVQHVNAEQLSKLESFTTGETKLRTTMAGQSRGARPQTID